MHLKKPFNLKLVLYNHYIYFKPQYTECQYPICLKLDSEKDHYYNCKLKLLLFVTKYLYIRNRYYIVYIYHI